MPDPADRQPDDSGRPLTSGPGQWLSILHAAVRLRVTDRSVRRMVAEGRLLRRLERGRAEVWVPESMPAMTSTDEPPDVTQDDPDIDVRTSPDDSDRALVVIGQQRAMIAWLNEQAREQTAPLVQRIEELSRENGRLQAELDAERARQVTAVDVRDTRPWWRRWFG